MRIATALGLLALFLVTDAAAQGKGHVTEAARQLPWGAASGVDLRQFFNKPHTVRIFLNEIQFGGDGDDPGVFAEVKEHRLVDLNGDGWLELVALVDLSGRKLYNNIEIVSRMPEGFVPPDLSTREFRGFVLRSVHGFNIEGLDSALKDVDTDGVYEIVVPQLLEEYEGMTRPHAVLPEVYGWNGREYQKASSKYSTYYQHVVLPELERQLQEVDAVPEATLNAREKAELQLRRAKYAMAIAEARKRAEQR